MTQALQLHVHLLSIIGDGGQTLETILEWMVF